MKTPTTPTGDVCTRPPLRAAKTAWTVCRAGIYYYPTREPPRRDWGEREICATCTWQPVCQKENA